LPLHEQTGRPAEVPVTSGWERGSGSPVLNGTRAESIPLGALDHPISVHSAAESCGRGLCCEPFMCRIAPPSKVGLTQAEGLLSCADDEVKARYRGPQGAPARTSPPETARGRQR
jgi:hypothetical protein